jgi:hypothetical protein
MQPDLTRLNLGTGDAQPAMSSMYNGGAPRSSQYTPRQMTVRDITKEFSDASAGTLTTAPVTCHTLLCFSYHVDHALDVQKVLWFADLNVRIAAGTIGQG